MASNKGSVLSQPPFFNDLPVVKQNYFNYQTGLGKSLVRCSDLRLHPDPVPYKTNTGAGPKPFFLRDPGIIK